MSDATTVELDFVRYELDTMRQRATRMLAEMTKRRTVRDFSSEPVPLEVVRMCIQTAAQAPSGANKLPWSFVLVSDPDLKRQIRLAAEREEREFYEGRAPKEWLDDLAPLGTDADKPFLEAAPFLIVVFAHRHGPEGQKYYYVSESVGIACGFLLAALHQAGLATLTHTPSPMTFLRDILQRPQHERAYLIVPVGYPAHGCRVPNITRKALSEVLIEHHAAPSE